MSADVRALLNVRGRQFTSLLEFVIMSERFRVTKSEKSVLFRNYGATEEPENDIAGKLDGSQIFFGNNQIQINKEEEERDTGRKP